MTQKHKAIEVIERLPDNATFEDIMAGLYFHGKVERGLADIERGRVATHEEAIRRLARWLQG